MYRPRLIHRASFHYSEIKRGQGLCELINYDVIGDPEYDCGAVGFSWGRTERDMRENVPYSLVVLSCTPRVEQDELSHPQDRNYVTPWAQGRQLYALLRTELLETLGGPEAISAGIQDVLEGRHQLAAPMLPRGPYCLWHDLEHDIYFAPNATFLKLVYSIMNRPPFFSAEIDNELHIGDKLKLATIINGRSCKSVFGMRAMEGPVTSLLPNQVTVKTHGKDFRMPYVYILTHEIPVLNEARPRDEK
uniref:Uncharacterized protein n=1 Tax=Pseudomonas phage HRDY3 TaxID=3236930 RepID=A0AB39CEX1_9VIRU